MDYLLNCIFWKNIILNSGKSGEHESHIELIFSICLFLTLFGNFSDSTSINDSLTIELSFELNHQNFI